MNVYKFRLQSLLDFRTSIRDQRHAEVSQANAARDQLATEQDRILDELKQLQVLQRSLSQGGSLDIARLVEIEQYGQSLRSRERALDSEIARWSGEAENRRAILCEANREVKLLEKLDDRHREQHRLESERKAANEIGELTRPGDALKSRVSI